MKLTPEEAFDIAVEMLKKEDAPVDIYRDLEVLIHACMWSNESHQIVADAASLVRKNHIMGDGFWR